MIDTYIDIIFNEAVLITSHSLIRLLAQHDYLIGTRCELLTHYRGCNYHIDRALLFFVTHYHVSNRSVDVRYTLVYLMRTATRSFFKVTGWWCYAAAAMCQFSVEVDMAILDLVLCCSARVTWEFCLCGVFGWFSMVDMMSSRCILGRGDDVLLSLQQPWWKKNHLLVQRQFSKRSIAKIFATFSPCWREQHQCLKELVSTHFFEFSRDLFG